MYGEAASSSPLSFAHSPRPTWAPPWKWVSISRSNAIDLFPEEVYSELRVDFRIFRKRLIVANDPESIKLICGQKAKSFRLSNLHKRMLKPALGGGLIVAEGDEWKRQRRISAKRAHPASFHENSDLISVRINQLVDILTDEKLQQNPRSVLDLLCSSSLDLIAASFFGHQEPIANSNVIDMLNRHRAAVENVDYFDVIGLPVSIPNFRMLRSQKISHELDDVIHTAVEKWGRDHNSKGIDFGATPRDFAVSILAGFESIAVTCNWALAILAHNPKLQYEIYQATTEQDTVSANGTLSAFVREVLRLFPPLPLIYRTAIEDVNVPIGIIKAGSVVCMSPWVVHRNRKLWPHPEKFSIERWVGRADDTSAYMPFGLGARQCIGMRLGLQLCINIIEEVVKRSEISTTDHFLPKPRAGVSLRPSRDIFLKFSPRKN